MKKKSALYDARLTVVLNKVMNCNIRLITRAIYEYESKAMFDENIYQLIKR